MLCWCDSTISISDLISFTFLLAQFDVFREDKRRFCWATVVEIDCSGSVMRICFRFPKTKDNHREWLDFGSPHICQFKSKVTKKQEKYPKAPKEYVTPVVSDPMDEASFFIGGKSQL